MQNSATTPPHHRISPLTATAIVVANMVGVGVFTSLGFQVGPLPSPFAILLLWTLGGLVALCGALSYAELATALPRSGGEYHFLSKIYHPSLGFVAGCISGSVGFAAPSALLAIAFANYLSNTFPSLHLHPTATSLSLLWLVTLAHLRGLRLGSALQNLWTWANLALILTFIFTGFLTTSPQPISFSPKLSDWPLIASAPFAVSLVYVMYAYSGWNASTYIVNEIHHPERNVPRSIFFGTLIVLALYLALNSLFLYTTPLSALDGKIDVALIAGRHIFGENGARLVASLLCVGLVASISSMTWIGPRVLATMGEDFPPLRCFSHLSPRNQLPTNALLFQSLIASLLILTSSFETVLTYTGFSLASCSFLTVLGLIILRFQQPLLPRPYRTFAYPLTPLLFLAVNAWMLYHLASSKPLVSLYSVATMLAALLVYFLYHQIFTPKNSSLPL